MFSSKLRTSQPQDIPIPVSMDIFRNCTMESHITTLTLMTQLIFYKIDLTINATTKRE